MNSKRVAIPGLSRRRFSDNIQDGSHICAETDKQATILGEKRGMMRWRLKELMQRYADVTGEPLLPRHIALATGLAASTVHQLVEGNPKRVSFVTGDILLTFFSAKLGPLTTSDLLEFVNTADS
jgi:hypothetical protein